jgi:hypothetical protein
MMVNKEREANMAVLNEVFNRKPRAGVRAVKGALSIVSQCLLQCISCRRLLRPRYCKVRQLGSFARSYFPGPLVPFRVCLPRPFAGFSTGFTERGASA